MRTEDSLHELETAISNLKWDVLGISELRRLGEAIEERSSYILYHKGEIAGQRGIGFLIKLHLKENIKEFIGVSDRIAALVLSVPGYKKDWVIIQSYAPIEQSSVSDRDYFYEKVSELIKLNESKHIILMGDFNAQVGSKQNNSEFVMGSFGYGKRSPNGQKLVEFLLEHNLVILNTMFKKKITAKWTWISPDGRYKNEIDYVMTNFPRAFTDTGVIQNLNFNTNHRMVRSTLKTKIPRKSSFFFLNKQEE